MSQEGASKPLTQGCFDLAILRYSLHFALESRGPNGRRTEHQIGREASLAIPRPESSLDGRQYTA